MANGDSSFPTDPSQLDPEMLARLNIPVTGQASGVAQNPPMTFQALAQYLPQGQTESAQPTGQLTQQQLGGRAPASIRYNNPGAMWPGPSSAKFGATSYGKLADGNLIAKFDDPVSGAAAQFDLLNSRRYIGRPIGDLIDEWSGHTGGAKNVAEYATHVANSIGLSPNDRLTPELLQSSFGISFAKAMARMEAGTDYPLSDQQWAQAQRMAFGDQVQGFARR